MCVCGWQLILVPLITSLQELGTSFPRGPSTVEGLFDWANYNAQTLFGRKLDEPENDARKSFIQLVSDCDAIECYESYAGIGTAGTTLVEQFSAMKDLVAGDFPQVRYGCALFVFFVYCLCQLPGAFGRKIKLCSAYDINAQCRMALASHPEADCVKGSSQCH